MNCLLSAFADEYSNDFGTQLAMLRENSVAYIEPRFIDQKNVADLTPAEKARRLGDKGLGDRLSAREIKAVRRLQNRA